MRLRHIPEVYEKLLGAMDSEDWATARKIVIKYDLSSIKGSTYDIPPKSDVDFNKFNRVYYILRSPEGMEWYYKTPDTISNYLGITLRSAQRMLNDGGGKHTYSRSAFAGWSFERVRKRIWV